MCWLKIHSLKPKLRRTPTDKRYETAPGDPSGWCAVPTGSMALASAPPVFTRTHTHTHANTHSHGHEFAHTLRVRAGRIETNTLCRLICIKLHIMFGQGARLLLLLLPGQARPGQAMCDVRCTAVLMVRCCGRAPMGLMPTLTPTPPHVQACVCVCVHLVRPTNSVKRIISQMQILYGMHEKPSARSGPHCICISFTLR